MVKEKALIILLTKLPKAGKVKSRLSAEIGAEKAAIVYENLLLHTLHILQQSEIPFVVSLEGNASEFERRYGKTEIWWQEPGDLGERMAHAFGMAFEQGHTQVVLIGGDCPEMSVEILQQAKEALSNCDLVIGPAQDGGYYLIGMNRLHAELFENMPWSTESVFQTTVQKAEHLNVRTQYLPQLRDIDDLADLNAFPSFAP